MHDTQLSMKQPNFREISDNELLWFYISSIGGCIGCIIVLFIAIQTIFNYYHIFKSGSSSKHHVKNINIMKPTTDSKNKTSNKTKLKQFHYEAVNKRNRQKIISCLTIAYLISSLITCLMYSFVRSNLLTRTNYYSFSIYRCSVGYFISISMFSISQTFMYCLFIFRIQIIFNETVYQYKPYYYTILYALNICHIIIVHIALIIFAIYNNQHQSYILYYSHYDDKLAFCSLDFTKNQNIMSSNPSIVVLFIFTLIIQFVIAFSLLWMFIKGLRDLNSSLLEQYINDHLDMNSNDMENLNDTILNKTVQHRHDYTSSSSLTIDLSQMSENKEETRSRSSTSLEMVMRRKSELSKSGTNGYCIDNDHGLQRVIRMHTLIKKQTILVVIAIFSALLTWILYLFIHKIWLLAAWDIILNSICIWLMFSFTKKYWKFAKRYCFCKICYLHDRIDQLLQSQIM